MWDRCFRVVQKVQVQGRKLRIVKKLRKSQHRFNFSQQKIRLVDHSLQINRTTFLLQRSWMTGGLLSASHHRQKRKFLAKVVIIKEVRNLYENPLHMKFNFSNKRRTLQAKAYRHIKNYLRIISIDRLQRWTHHSSKYKTLWMLRWREQLRL